MSHANHAEALSGWGRPVDWIKSCRALGEFAVLHCRRVLAVISKPACIWE